MKKFLENSDAYKIIYGNKKLPENVRELRMNADSWRPEHGTGGPERPAVRNGGPKSRTAPGPAVPKLRGTRGGPPVVILGPL